MASHGYSPWLVEGASKVIKDSQPFLPCPGAGTEIIKPISVNMRPVHSEKPCNPLSGYPASDKFVKIDSMIQRPSLVDIQDTNRDSVLLSFGIAEQCTRQEKIMQFLMSGSGEMEGGLDLSSISDLIGLQPSLVYPNQEFLDQKLLVDFVGDLVRDSKITVHQDGQVSFTGHGNEMKDLLSIVAEFYISKNSTNSRKQTVVPYFNRPKRREARTKSSLTLKTLEVAPLKSSETLKHKDPSKKCNKKAGTRRDLYTKNYFTACESLLSLIIDKRRDGKKSVLWLKNSGPELPQLLTQCSASIAGTGLAVLLSVIFKVSFAKVPFCASKVLNTGLGFGLVWLSWAVNRLRDAIVNVTRNSIKLESREEDIIRTVDKSVNEIFFRVAALMAVAVMRLA